MAKRLSGCGSGTEYLAVTPWGDLYPCHQFVGQEEFLLGNVEEGITKPEIPEEFRGCSVYSKDSCRNCFARFYCSGGCMANSYKFHHTINDTYEVSCEMERRRVECAIMIKAALILLIAGVIPKFSSLLTTIPYCVLGGATVSVFASIAMTGMKLITSQNMTFRNTSIVGLAAALGMGISQASDSLASFPDWFVMIFGKSPVVVATLLAVLLNIVLPKDKEDAN